MFPKIGKKNIKSTKKIMKIMQNLDKKLIKKRLKRRKTLQKNVENVKIYLKHKKKI